MRLVSAVSQKFLSRPFGTRLFCLLQVLVLLGFCLPALAEEPPEPLRNSAAKKKQEAPRFLRLRRAEDDQPVALETVIATYRNDDGVEVDLIGAVHIGEREYYRQLNKDFENYDALLYELVGEKDTRPEPGQRGGGAVRSLQTGMQSLLGLSYQLDEIDYKQKNFVHADMTPEEFSKSMSDRRENIVKMMFRSMGYNLATQPEGDRGNLGLLMALFSGDRAFYLKREMASQLAQADGVASMLEGEDGSAIVTDRNAKAFEVLKKQIDAGHKKLGVFYGAAHLADMERLLINDFGMKRVGERWLVAWDLTPQPQ